MATIDLGRVGFVNKGTYSGVFAYKLNDVVVYNSGTYACIQANTGQLPTVTAYWQVWVSNDKAPLDSPALVNPTINGVAQSGYSGFKNYIINGGFDVWQRGTSQTTGGYGSDDRWANADNGSTKTHSLVNATDAERALFNSSKFSRTVVTSVAGASNFVLKQQAIEDVTKLAGKTVTISFWAKADSDKSIEPRLLQDFGTGGSPSVFVVAVGIQLIALTSIWQKKTITVVIPSIIGKTLGTDGAQTTATWLRFTFDAGSSVDGSIVGQQSGTFDIAEVQLEEGSVATPFEQRPYGLELSLCQRYYESTPTITMYGVGDGTNTVFNYQFKVVKRVTPSLSNTYVGFTPTAENAWTHGFSCYKSGVSNLYSISKIIASAEL